MKRAIRSASILKAGRAVFNIAGNKYRIGVWINYPYRVVYVRFIGTRPQYDGVDAQLLHALRRLASIRLSESWGAVSLCRKQIVSAAVG